MNTHTELPELPADLLAEMAPPIEPLTHDEVVVIAREILTNVRWFGVIGEPEFEAFEMLIRFGGGLCMVPQNAFAMHAKIEDAGPRAVNGNPVFFGGTWFPRENRDELIDEYNKMRAALGFSS